jgi:hypothetical protein
VDGWDGDVEIPGIGIEGLDYCARFTYRGLIRVNFPRSLVPTVDMHTPHLMCTTLAITKTF